VAEINEKKSFIKSLKDLVEAKSLSDLIILNAVKRKGVSNIT
jgi:hypothetical protein